MTDYDDLDKDLQYLNNVNALGAKYMQLRFYALPDMDPDHMQDRARRHYHLGQAVTTDEIEIPQGFVIPPTTIAAATMDSPFARPAENEYLEESVHLLGTRELGLADAALACGRDEGASDRELWYEFSGECADAFDVLAESFEDGLAAPGDCTFGMMPLLVTERPRTKVDDRLHGAALVISTPLFAADDAHAFIRSNNRMFPDLAHYRAFAYYLKAMYRKATGGTVASAYRQLVGHQGLSARI